MGKVLRVGIAGLGRSGWSIHALGLESLEGRYRVSAVSDPCEDRRQEAKEKFGCRVNREFEELAADPDLDLIVVATPSHRHVEHATAALNAGCHVVCEKPLAASIEELDRVLALAKEKGLHLAPFQNRRYEPAFQKVQQVIASGKLGRIVQIRMAGHGFSRRWDWQTLKEYGGGSLNNTGPHFLDQALELFGPGEPEIFCHMDKALASGDAEDHVKVILRGPGKPLVEVEITSACAYPQDAWLVMGTTGGLTGTPSRLSWKYVDFSGMPPRPIDRSPADGREYNHEPIEFTEESWDLGPNTSGYHGLTHQFYNDLYGPLLNGSPLTITPESVRRQIVILERCHELHPL